jgi:hypothetical protein
VAPKADTATDSPLGAGKWILRMYKIHIGQMEGLVATAHQAGAGQATTATEAALDHKKATSAFGTMSRQWGAVTPWTQTAECKPGLKLPRRSPGSQPAICLRSLALLFAGPVR